MPVDLRLDLTGGSYLLTDLKTSPQHLGGVLDVNNRYTKETSFLTPDALERLIAGAHTAIVAERMGAIVETSAFLIAYDQDGEYDSPNFLWFRERYARFLYIDRVVVDATAQGQGWGRRLYAHLIAVARACGHERILAEINIDPPNSGSLAFHDRIGFIPVGERNLPNGKSVRYVALEL